MLHRLSIACLALALIALGRAFAMPAPLMAADEAHPVEATDGEQAAGEHHETGVPLAPKPNLLIWSLVTFVVFLFVLKLLAWQPLIEGLNTREKKMFQAVAEAQGARNEAAALLAEHKGQMEAADEQVKEILAEARRDAEHTKNDIIATAQREAEATKDRAIAEIDRAKDQALSELFDRMADQVAGATETVVGRSLDPNDQKRLIDEALSQFGNQSA